MTHFRTRNELQCVYKDDLIGLKLRMNAMIIAKRDEEIFGKYVMSQNKNFH